VHLDKTIDTNIENLPYQNQALSDLVEEQRERIEGFKSGVGPERRGLWGRVFALG
jgi:hypothetical protein